MPEARTPVMQIPAHRPRPTLTPTPTPTPAPSPTGTPAPFPVGASTPVPEPEPAAAPPTLNPSSVLSDIIKKARPSVVRIVSAYDSGSGTIFETQDRTAYIVTNHHVLQGASEASVSVDDSTTYIGKVLGSDPVRDLAVLSICCGQFQALPLGDASRLEPGDEVVAIGYALGLSGQATITRGIVSATRYDPDYLSEVIQTDAAINPGNSGGPMLSATGQVLGINAFRSEETGAGRPVQGVGFAISATTLREQIPVLKSVDGAASTVPGRRPGSTPTYGASGDYWFGPISGELWHDPSNGLIESEYADVFSADMIVSATFANPYSTSSNPWDYGFMLRNSGTGSYGRYIQVVVTSSGRWDVVWRQGKSHGSNEIASGTLKAFDTGAGGKNNVTVFAFGAHGLLFVNGEFISTLDFSDVTGAGSVGVITGAYTGDESAGAVTRFEDFEGWLFRKEYGPASGRLEYEPGIISEQHSDVWAQDLVVEAEFVNPPNSDWSYGFVIRHPENTRLDVVGVTGNRMWFHQTRSAGAGNGDYAQLSGGLCPGGEFPRQEPPVPGRHSGGWPAFHQWATD